MKPSESVEDLSLEFEEIDYYRDQYYPRNRKRFIDSLKEVDSLPPGKGLEIGSGFGDLAIALAKAGWKMAACDYFLELSKNKIQKYNIDYRKVNVEAEALPFADESFDLVCMGEVLEHFNYSPTTVLDEINRVLKPGGFVLLSTPNTANLLSIAMLLTGKNVYPELFHYYIDIKPVINKGMPYFDRHNRLYIKQELQQLLQQCGFDIARFLYRVENVNPGSSLPKRLMSRFSARLVEMTNWRLFGEYMLVLAQKR